MTKLSTFEIKCVIFVIALIPLLLMLWNALTDSLGPNPVEALAQESGIWSLRFLLITLAFTPAKMIFKQPGLQKYRRVVALFTFFYCSVHFFIFIGFEHSFSFALIIEDLYNSPTVMVGLLAYLLLVPLTVTSTNNMMRKLGKNWKKLHSAVYVIGLLAILHFALTVKADLTRPFFYGFILLALFVIRGVVRNNKKTTASKPEAVKD
ncbi:MAG: sulfoxide reductase heme-binding subunit YedZ [Gammaproteobacteria bacterium HGW-Gammaproteobacteria-10]|nr:MAG: sulfoxide reductase heme-binding subunit YedZ [Gammaproteobacteria bacterium HGW-Gammaproteobacteria-10]